MAEKKKLGLRDQVLLAAVACSGGDLSKTFSAEDLLLRAWKDDPYAWGLREHEREHPDSEKIYTELDRANVKGGMVGLGLLEKVQRRIYRLTPAGLAKASNVGSGDPGVREKAHRVVEEAIRQILAHPVFCEWLADPSTPKRFRAASHFWNIAAGTPPEAVQARIRRIEDTLSAASDLLEEKGVDEVSKHRGKRLYERQDIVRAREFHNALKTRFASELRLMGAPPP